MRSIATFVVSLVIFASTAALRFLGLVGFTNDQYISLAGAQQMLFGERPTRDFLDPGLPLAYVASAAAQLVFGRNLFAEAMLTSLAFGLAAALTVMAARRLSGSLLIGVIAALVEVAMFPRGYSYPKMLLYAAAPLVIWWYVKRPSWGRMSALALFVQVAFLFRHDHGLFIGIGAAVAVALAGDGIRSTRVILRQLASFASMALAAAVPYLVYIAVNGGVMRYLSQGVRFSAAEAAENGLVLPLVGTGLGLHPNSEALLFFLFYLLPVIAGVVLALRWRQTRDTDMLARVAPLVVIAVVVNRGFLRDELATRLADAIVPAVLLSAWLVAQIRFAPTAAARIWIRTVSLVIVALATVAVTIVGATVENLNRASLFGGLRRMPERFAERSAELHDRFNERQMPTGPVDTLVPFFRYVDRCTLPEHRLLVPGFIPEVPVYAHRPFAAGRSTILPGYLDSPAERRQLLAIVDRQVVPFVVVTSRSKEQVWNAYPDLAAFIDTHFAPLVTYRFGDGLSVVVDVFASRTLPTRGTDDATGWPCFK